ncbi:Probable reactivating factor for D-ornithine aminomutase [Olavius algarvensis associated proteobacterium Delta 3]|nr:Probable reactivating factor for D-ornithine aminomutase [Olavius algarvensis associated proteobacterium Delta 3]CAB5118922.1 Probable reactivating factor for D-ornithine aminomutase [Olavius algarvensis associated proteobacterium Delta 3]
MKHAEIIAADIGSTITKVSAFSGLGSGRNPSFLGQGLGLTTVAEGDVMQGLEAARKDLVTRLGVNTRDAVLMAASSAAGGLRMTVHGLTRDMTLRAAREASLGAGAIVMFTTAGQIYPDAMEEVRRIKPNIILLAGGVDYGDRDIVMANARALASLKLDIPLVYAGNKTVRSDIGRLFDAAGMPVFIVDNVYPRIDELNIDPVRKVIQDVFAHHIVTAPGMENIRQMVRDDIMPTPGAVMRSTEILAETMGDIMTVDVGGATTDVHSVTEGSPEFSKMMIAPEPRSKRTVEGDLGVYINASRIVEAAGSELPQADHVRPIPDTAGERDTSVRLARWAVDISIWRHAGQVRVAYGAYGRNELVEGRDLSAVKHVIGTGGALTRLGMGREILQHVKPDPRKSKLLPPVDAAVYLDHHNIMAAAGVLSLRYPQEASALLLESVGFIDTIP